jgi:hypothetical protein
MSISSTSGSGRFITRSRISMRVYLPCAEFCQLSSDGVAEPITTTAPSSLARITATSRAL